MGSKVRKANSAYYPEVECGLSAVSLASSYGGYSALEKAVHKAYYKKKGIKVYYKIHKSVMNMNKVRYVVG